jgi:phage repressor protein C with HTH and peptisase S24 domain
VGPWTGATSFFAVKVFYKNGDNFVIAQHEFRREFRIYRNRAVPAGHAMKTWVRNLEATGFTLKKKGGNVKSVEHWLQTARVKQSSEAQNGVDSGFF